MRNLLQMTEAQRTEVTRPVGINSRSEFRVPLIPKSMLFLYAHSLSGEGWCFRGVKFCFVLFCFFITDQIKWVVWCYSSDSCWDDCKSGISQLYRHHLLQMRRVRFFVQIPALRFSGKSHMKMVHLLPKSPKRMKALWGQAPAYLIYLGLGTL